MQVQCLGLITGDASYTDKKTDQVHARLNVDVDANPFQISVPSVEEFCLYDQVVITGDLGVFDKRFFFRDAVLTLASREDVQRLSSLKGSGLRVRESPEAYPVAGQDRPPRGGRKTEE